MGLIVTVVANGHVDTSSRSGRVYISHHANAYEEGMNPTILPPTLRK